MNNSTVLALAILTFTGAITITSLLTGYWGIAILGIIFGVVSWAGVLSNDIKRR